MTRGQAKNLVVLVNVPPQRCPGPEPRVRNLRRAHPKAGHGLAARQPWPPEAHGELGPRGRDAACELPPGSRVPEHRVAPLRKPQHLTVSARVEGSLAAVARQRISVEEAAAGKM